jgi:hypothetical protein
MDGLLNLLLKALGSAVVFGGVFLAYYWFLIEVVLASSDHGRSKGSVVQKTTDWSRSCKRSQEIQSRSLSRKRRLRRGGVRECGWGCVWHSSSARWLVRSTTVEPLAPLGAELRDLLAQRFWYRR